MKEWLEEIKNKIRFKIISFLDKKKLFGINKKCWADLVCWGMGFKDWEDVGEARCKECEYCRPKEYGRDKDE